MKASLRLVIALIFAALPVHAAETPLPAGIYSLDKTHASLAFNVNHLGFSHYTMNFDHFDATLQLDPAQPEKARLTATIDPLSLDLPNPPEGFSKEITTGEKWLNAETYPSIVFLSHSVKMTGEKTADIHGVLEMLGQKKPVLLHAVFNGGYKGHAMDPHARVGFSAKASFKRSDFGMNFGIPEPGTTMGVGDEVDVMIEAEFTGPAMTQK